MFAGSISLGSFKKIPMSIHWSAALIAVLIGSNLVGVYGVAPGVFGVLAFLGSIIAHELGHALTARRYGVRTESIDLWALGGIAKLDRPAPSPRAEGWIAVAGPLTSLVIGVLSIGTVVALAVSGLDSAFIGVLGWLGVVNGVLAVFNMLPGAPLDGGRLLKAWRWGRHGDQFRAAREAASAGVTLGWSLAGLGLVLLLAGQAGIMLAITGMFIASSAKAEERAADLAEALHGVRVGDLTWWGIADAPIDTDAETMVWQRARLGNAGVVAVRDSDGSVVGLVDEDQLLAVPLDRRPWTPIASLMTPTARLTRAEPDEELSTVLGRLDPRRPLVTVWRGNTLLGVVPRQRLLQRLRAAPAN
jgi:Zn-dependent protease